VSQVVVAGAHDEQVGVGAGAQLVQVGAGAQLSQLDLWGAHREMLA
jgi:hypothetical protein